MLKQEIEGYRISPFQRRLWLLQSAGCVAVQQGYVMVHLEGELDKRRLKSVIATVASRYEVLRTKFYTLPGSSIPVQVVDEVAIEFEEMDQELNGHDPGSFFADDPSFAAAERPVLRCKLFCSAPQKHTLLLGAPSLCADAPSLGFIVHQICHEYWFGGAESGSNGNPILQYPDIAEWLNNIGNAEGAEVGRQYWSQQIFGPAGTLEKQEAETSDAEFKPESLALELRSGAVKTLFAGEREGRWKAPAVLLAAWSLLLSRFGRAATCIAIACDCRANQVLTTAIGPLTRHVPLAANWDGAPTFADMCAGAAKTMKDAAEWQEFFDWDDIEKEKQAGPAALYFPVSFEYLELHDLVAPAGQLRFRISQVNSCADRIGIHLSCKRFEDSLACELHWNKGMYAREEIERLADCLPVLLGNAVHRPESGPNHLRILNKAEHKRVTEELNPRAVVFEDHDSLVHEIFAAQAAKTPNAVAVRFEDQELTYKSLDALATRVAAYLSEHGVKPEILVGICLERSLEMVIAILGILKAGGAYLPLDPDYPPDRLAFMLRDSRAKIVITTAELFEAMAGCAEFAPIREILNHQSARVRVATRVDGENPAYVLYTSGSTGRPKGVVISHRALRNHMGWMLQQFPFSNECVLQKTTFSFDACVWEFFAPLMTGSCLVMARPGGQRDREYLIQCIQDEQITVLQLVPSQLQMLVEDERLKMCTSLKRVFCGGEVLTTSLVKHFYARLPHAVLYNLYGPTEATIDASFAECSADEAMLTVPIGHPIDNAQAYTLDDHYEPVPVGVTGELYIGGAGLGRGYLGRPDLTAERFVPNPFSHTPGGRLYRTGDLAKWNSEGNLEYLGRIDAQVKLHGFRIELGEIETVLGQYSPIAQAVVAVRVDPLGVQRLTAYLIRKKDTELLDGKHLRDYLKERLPVYMVPTAFLELNEMPLTPNGKVDRRALPEPEENDKLFGSVNDGPKTAIEELVAGIWEQVLRVPYAPRDGNFFELGGHSLLAAQVVSRVRTVFETELPLRTLFEYPTVSRLAQEIEKLRGNTKFQILPIRRMDRDRDFPLSYAQQRLWFMEQLNPQGPLYIIPLKLHLHGELDRGALQRSFTELLRRHEVLRTSFPMKADGPVQKILPEGQIEIDFIDLSELPDDERRKGLDREVWMEANRGFDLACAPLLRVKLLKLAKQDHMLLVTMHHIISDGWSMNIMAREVGRLYGAFISHANIAAVLPELKIQYADYAVWQREWLQGTVLEDHLGYWKKQLENAPAVLELPLDRPRPAVASYRGAQQTLVIPGNLTARLKTLGRVQSSTLFMTLLAAYQVLLGRYSGQDDVVVGTTIAARRHTETEQLIGMFVNMLALRSNFSADPPFRQLLKQVRETTLSAYAYQDLPFERLVAELQLERSLNHSPIFQVIFELHNAPEENVPLPGLQMQRVEVELGTAKFDLRLSLTEVEGELNGMFEYNPDLFHADTIKRMAGHYQALLEAVVANPDRPLSELSILSAAEFRHIIHAWNSTRQPYPQDCCIHDLFEAQAQKTPFKIALECEGVELSYLELDRKANQLARYLQALGVGPEGRVGICLEHSPELIIGLLAILKAGAAYVPLDPTYPSGRLSFMLEDAQVPVLLTHSALLKNLPAGWTQVLCIDHEWEKISDLPTAGVGKIASPGNLAYVLYTSGSTGQPKGVSLEHRSLVNYICWARQVYVEAEANFDFPLYSSIAFDLTVTSIFMPLVNGGCIHIYRASGTQQVDLITRVFADDASGTIKLTPSHLATVNRLANRNLRQLIVGGEALENKLARRITQNARSPIAIWNEYGPTEATVGCMLYQYDPATEQGANVPIGRPAGNSQIYVLDQRLEPVPIGVAGEIYIGGVCLARGYMNKPGLTAEKFIPNPFKGSYGTRLYRTGDRARFIADGSLEFLGRSDDQVKVRGFRIELGEIEAALAAHSQVKYAAAIVRDDAGTGRRLVGYVVPAADAVETTAEELKKFLRTRLPEYMVPADIVKLNALPLNANGKLDRKALPMPEKSAAGLSALPRTDTELKLATLWQDVLQTSSFIGRDQSFFDLGGHSLLAIALMARIKEQFGQDLPLAVLFEDPTIEHLANVLRQKDASGARTHLLPIHRQGSKRPVFFVHPLGGNGINYILLARLLGEDQPFYSFQAVDEVEAARETIMSVEERAALYIQFMREVQPEGPYLIGGWSWGGYVAYEIARQLEHQGLGIAALFLLDISAYILNELPEQMDDAEFLLSHVHSNRLRFADDDQEMEKKMMALSLDGVQGRSVEERLQYMLDELIKIKLIRPEVQITQVRNYIRGCLNRAQSLLDYRIAPYSGPITLLKTPGSRLPTEEPDGPHDPLMGWGAFSPNVKVYPVTGNHFNMVFSPHIERVAEVLKNCLSELALFAKAAS